MFKRWLQNQILNRKIIFVIVFLPQKVRYSFLKNLKLALGIKRVTRNSLTFLTVIKKKEITKTIKLQLFVSPGKLKRYCKQK